ncbi:MAG: hypothetical protein ACOC93_06555 [Planctomycetota bacterium]
MTGQMPMPAAYQDVLAALDAVERRFEPRPGWQALRTACRAAGEPPRGGERVRTAAAAQDLCGCCQLRPADGEDGLCWLCRRLYATRPARMVDGCCDCGHDPRGRRIYVRQPDSPEARMFCSLPCARADYQETFAFQLRLLGKGTPHAAGLTN